MSSEMGKSVCQFIQYGEKQTQVACQSISKGLFKSGWNLEIQYLEMKRGSH